MYSENLDLPKLLSRSDVGCDHRTDLAIANGRVSDAFVDDRWNWFRRNSFCKTLWTADAQQSNNKGERVPIQIELPLPRARNYIRFAGSFM